MEPPEARTRWRTTTSLLDGLAHADNAEAWSTFVDLHRPLMIGYFRKIGINESDAEEVAQQSLVEFARAYGRGAYDRRKGRLRDWLFGIARNQLAQLRRDQARQQASGGVEQDSLPDPDPNSLAWEHEWRQHSLRSCFLQIEQEVSLESLEAFRLFCVQDVPASEVARALGMTENAVYLNKRRILRRIRELLDQMENEDQPPDAPERP